MSDKHVIEMLIKHLQPLVDIANAYDENGLDAEARKYWGSNNETVNRIPPENIELYTGRGGRQLLTLKHCLDARAAIEGYKAR